MSEKEKENVSITNSHNEEDIKKAEESLKDSVKFEDFISSDTKADTPSDNKEKQEFNNGAISLETVSHTEYEKLQKELSDTKELLLRVAADFENYKKRVAKEKEDLVKFANESILRDLLETVDNLELTLIHSRQSTIKNEDIIRGFEITVKGFIEFLKRYGVTPLDMSNTIFDPNFHEAIGAVQSDTIPAGHIIKVERKGYVLKDRLLRPALVVVSRGRSNENQATDNNKPEPEHKCIAEPEPEKEN